MSATVFGIILFAAVLHATWNAIVKEADDKLATAVLVSASAAVIAAVTLPFLQQPASASWPYLAVATVLQITYYSLLAAAYRDADMSQAYPLMRGVAPLLVAAAGALWIGETLPPAAWAGIALISGGVIGTALAARGLGKGRGIAFALVNAIVIAGYTLTDGIGVRLSGTAAGYVLWEFLLTGVPLFIYAAATRRGSLLRYGASNLLLAVIGGVGTLVSYGLALWAMTMAPVGMVAALRESSILFGIAIAALVLKERVSPSRIAAAGVIAAGAILLRLA